MLTPAELVWLIAAVAKGDEAAFERLYAATRAKLFGVVLRILRRQDLAEEVIQEAYVKIWNSAGQFNPGLSSPITWMASIARRATLATTGLPDCSRPPAFGEPTSRPLRPTMNRPLNGGTLPTPPASH